MDPTNVIELVQNVTLIVTLCVFHRFISRKWNPEQLRARLLFGGVYGAVAVIGMLNPWHVTPGVVFDARSVVASLAGLFGGGVTGLVTAAMAGAARLWMGGDGALTGCGVVVTSALLGILYKRFRGPGAPPPGAMELYRFGWVVHLVMLAWMLTLPHGKSLSVLQTITLPVLALFPLVTMVVGWGLTDQDAQRRAENALQASEARFEAMFTQSSVGVVLTDLEGRVQEANPAYERMLGYGPGELRGVSIIDLTVAEDRPAQEHILGSVVPKKVSRGHIYEKRYVRKDGVPVWVRVAGNTLRDPAGHPFALVGIVENISEAREAREKLAQSMRLLQSIIDSSADFIFVKDLQLRSLLCNQAYARAAGKTPEALRGKTDLENGWDPELIQGNPAKGIRGYETDDRAALAGQTVRNPFDPACVEGARRVFDTIKLPLRDDSGAIMGVLGVSRDVTERRQAEDALRASLEEKEVLLKEIHHRVKNNLQIVSSLLHLQTSRVKSPEVRALLEDTRLRVRSMALLHETLYRSENLARLDMVAYVEALCAHLLRVCGHGPARILLERELEPVLIDLEQAVPCGLIINELVSNAFKHAFPESRDGRIVVELHQESPGRALLAVWDDGAGLPPDVEARRAETLGARLVSSLASQLRGTLEILPKGPAGGAAFRVRFPLRAPGAPEPHG